MTTAQGLEKIVGAMRAGGGSGAEEAAAAEEEGGGGGGGATSRRRFTMAPKSERELELTKG